MTERQLLHLARLAEQAESAARSAGSPRALCLSFARSRALAAGLPAAPHETAHRSACRACDSRVRQLAASRQAAEPRPIGWLNRWARRISAAAVAAALLLTVYPRPRGGVPMVADPWSPTPYGLEHARLCLAGDANCDGAVTMSDLPALILAIARPDLYCDEHPGCDSLCSNDMNHDGAVNATDLSEFIQCVSAD